MPGAVVFPTRFLEAESAGGNFLFSKDRIPYVSSPVSSAHFDAPADDPVPFLSALQPSCGEFPSPAFPSLAATDASPCEQIYD